MVASLLEAGSLRVFFAGSCWRSLERVLREPELAIMVGVVGGPVVVMLMAMLVGRVCNAEAQELLLVLALFLVSRVKCLTTAFTVNVTNLPICGHNRSISLLVGHQAA